MYFVRGFFITVSKQVAILDQYTNTPTYRIGLLIDAGTGKGYNYPDNVTVDLMGNAK